jgi:Zn-dependent M28 family amino/carboxypeptidase
MVVVSGNEDGQIGHFIAKGYPAPTEPIPIPGVAVDADGGARLVALLTAGERLLRVEHGAEYPHVETANVVAELPGTDAPDERVVIGAHYDTQLEGVGACDNATGVAALLEIARTWSPLSLTRTVVLVAFADEEHGCRGSIEYCRRNRDTLERTVAMVNLDALAWAAHAKRALHADPSIHDFARACAVQLGWEPEVEREASLFPGADHHPFIDAGVPACWFWRYPPPHPYYHSEGDTPEIVDFDQVAETATVAASTAFRLASEPEPGLGRSRPTTRWLELRQQEPA